MSSAAPQSSPTIGQEIGSPTRARIRAALFGIVLGVACATGPLASAQPCAPEEDTAAVERAMAGAALAAVKSELGAIARKMMNRVFHLHA